MKATKLVMVILLLGVASGLFAQQGLNIAVFAGYANPVFDSDIEDYVGDFGSAIPVGLRISKEVTPKIQLGVEGFYPVVPFKAEDSGDYYGFSYKSEIKFKQMFVGAFAKMILSESSSMTPYAKAGVGMYMGGADVKATILGQSDTDNLDIDSGIGFNVGAGIDLASMPIFIEFNYHIVSRNIPDFDEEYSMGFWDILVGYTLTK